MSDTSTETKRTTVSLEAPLYEGLARISRERILAPRGQVNITGAIRWLYHDYQRLRQLLPHTLTDEHAEYRVEPYDGIHEEDEP